MKIDAEYEKAYSSFVDLVLDNAIGAYPQKRELADKLWALAQAGMLLKNQQIIQAADEELLANVHEAVRELSSLCEKEKTVPSEKVLSIVRCFMF